MAVNVKSVSCEQVFYLRGEVKICKERNRKTHVV